ncbi:hypothetical protein [Ligilactobacillus apodemi]|uniref:Uncharacterized protein n=1 Tax=Ligilactobacillus apodemi DSM 16634 = JCM 16172 TaxID=1423724 RepID=A0A0R1TRH7_9LACO|nr:hypothetical protein [Ligilactobacillus apodemi]KRL84017.1 hypothetical protein FC32_GL001293 [Ligilactobacillus apodemi DSM 16634 = JCM 16172]
MGVTNASDYTITPHASERIKQRFGQTLDSMRDWTERLLNLCEFVKHEDNGRDHYRYRDIGIILDLKKKQVITMFPEPQDVIKLDKKSLNPELQTSVNEMIAEFLEKKRRETAESVHSKVFDIEQAAADFYINSSENNLIELRSVLRVVDDELAKYDMFVAETKLVTRK